MLIIRLHYELNPAAGCYKPHVHEEVKYPETKALISEVMETEDKIAHGLKSLFK